MDTGIVNILKEQSEEIKKLKDKVSVLEQKAEKNILLQ